MENLGNAVPTLETISLDVLIQTIQGLEKCTTQHAQTVEQNAKYRLNLLKENQCTAENVIPATNLKDFRCEYNI